MLLHYLEKQKAEIASFHLNTECCLLTNTGNTFNRSQLNCSSFWQESAVCTKQHLVREYKHATIGHHTLIIYQVCHDVGCCVKSGNYSLSSLKWKVNRQYWWDILLSQQMLAVNALPFSNTAHACTSPCVHNTVQQLLCKTVNFISPELWQQQARAELNYKI